MTPPDASWERPDHRPGGGDAFVFYVVYAEQGIRETLDVSEERHRTRGVPQGIHFLVRQRHEAAFTPADFASDASDEAYAAAERASIQFVLAGTVPDPSDLLYLRDVLGIVHALVDSGATAVFDLQTLSLWTAEEFLRDQRAADRFVREDHVAFFRSAEQGGSSWFHTRGMRKFGRPDVSIREVPEALADAAADLLHRFAELGIRGGSVPEGEPVRARGWPAGYSCTHEGSFDDPEFNNVHVSVVRDAPEIPG